MAPGTHELPAVTWKCGVSGAVAGVLMTFEPHGKTNVDVVLTRYHRVVVNPAVEIHPAFGAFKFVDGVATLTPKQATALRSVFAGLNTDAATT